MLKRFYFLYRMFYLYVSFSHNTQILFSFGQMLVISIAIGIIGGLAIRICKDVFTYIRWTIKQRKIEYV